MPEALIPSEITRLLHRWEAGDREALARVISLVYEDLHAIASDIFGAKVRGTRFRQLGW